MIYNSVFEIDYAKIPSNIGDSAFPFETRLESVPTKKK